MITHIRRSTVLLSTLVLLALPAVVAGNGGGRDKATAFRLADQFGRAVDYRFPREKVSVLIFGDWKGSAQIEGWVGPLWERYKSEVEISGVAVLDIVPKIFRNFAREQFRERVKFPVLLDFEGDVSKAYGFRSNNANILVIAPNGAITLRVVGEATPTSLRRVYAAIDQLRSQAARR